MKQLSNKYLIGLFILCSLMLPLYKSEADTMISGPFEFNASLNIVNAAEGSVDIRVNRTLGWDPTFAAWNLNNDNGNIHNYLINNSTYNNAIQICNSDNALNCSWLDHIASDLRHFDDIDDTTARRGYLPTEALDNSEWNITIRNNKNEEVLANGKSFTTTCPTIGSVYYDGAVYSDGKLVDYNRDLDLPPCGGLQTILAGPYSYSEQDVPIAGINKLPAGTYTAELNINPYIYLMVENCGGTWTAYTDGYCFWSLNRYLTKLTYDKMKITIPFTIHPPLSLDFNATDNKISGQSKPLTIDPTTKETTGVKYNDNNVALKWSVNNFPDPDKVVCTLPDGSKVGYGTTHGDYLLNTNLTQNTNFSVTCTDDVPPPTTTISGSNCPSSSDKISETLVMHTSQGTGTMTSWDGTVHHEYSVWVTSSSIIPTGAKVKVSIVYRQIPYSGATAPFVMLDCLNLIIPAGGDTSNKIPIMAIDNSVTGGVSSSSYSQTTKIPLSASEINNYLTASQPVVVSTGLYNGHTQSVFNYSVTTNHTFPGDLYVTVKGGYSTFPYEGATTPQSIDINKTFIIPAGGTTSTEVGNFMGTGGGVGIQSAYYITYN